jgi:hypothetical protein
MRLVDNVIEKPDGIVISFGFIFGIGVVSLVSRVWRSTELRAERIEFDDTARASSPRPSAAGAAHHRQQAPGRRRPRVPAQGARAAPDEPHPG